MKITSNIVYAMGAMVLGLVILFVSITRAGLAILAIDGNKNIRVLPIEFEIEGEKRSYKFPIVSTLPTSPVYGLKNLRDTMWVKLSNNPIEKVEVSLLMADKKMSEVIELSKQNRSKLVLEGCIEGINKLKYTNKLLNEIGYKNSKTKEIDKQIYEAGFAYKEIIETDCETLVNDIDNWNENYKKNI